MPTTILSPADFTYDSNKIQVVSGSLKLKYQEGDLTTKTSNFTTAGDYTYDNTKIDLSGGNLKLKNIYASGSTFYASLTSSINGDSGGGVLTGTAVGGAAISGGKLDLTYNDTRRVTYTAIGNADSTQTGCFRLRITPNYSGAPASLQVFGIINTTNSLNNLVQFYHTGASLIGYINSSVGVNIVSISGAWSPVAGTEYELELNWDLTTGATRLFVDGVQLGSTVTNTGTRVAPDQIKLGSNYDNTLTNNYKIGYAAIFSTVQHTGNYTPTNSYTTTNPTLDFTVDAIDESTALGIWDFNSLSGTVNVTGNDAITFTVSLDGGTTYLYWNGSSWTTSTGYAQSNTLSVFNTNITSLSLTSGKFKLRAFVHSDTGNTTPDADDIVVSYNKNKYNISDPIFTSTGSFLTDDLTSLANTVTVAGSDSVKYIMKLDNIDKYWNGSSWANSNGSLAQSNTITEITTNAASLITSIRQTLKLVGILHSNDGTASPLFTNATLVYSYAAATPTLPTINVVYGFLIDAKGTPISGVTITAESYRFSLQGSFLVPKTVVSVTSDADGYWELPLIETATTGEKMLLKFTGTNIALNALCVIPNTTSVNFSTLSIERV